MGIRSSGSAPAGSFDVAQLGDALRPTGYISTNIPRSHYLVDEAMLTTQTLCLQALYIPAGVTVTNVIFASGDTGTTLPTNWWFALYSSALGLLGQSADQTTDQWASNTVKTLALGTPYPVTAGGLYYAGVMVKATGMPSLHGTNHRASTINALVPKLSGTSTAALTTTAPGTAAAISVGYQNAWCAVS